MSWRVTLMACGVAWMMSASVWADGPNDAVLELPGGGDRGGSPPGRPVALRAGFGLSPERSADASLGEALG